MPVGLSIDASGLITGTVHWTAGDENGVSYLVTIGASDGHGGTTTTNMNWMIADINRVPTLDSANFTVQEHSSHGYAIGRLHGSDPDSGQTLSYEIVSGNEQSIFNLDSTGQLTVNSSAKLDYETTSSHSLTVRVTDSGNPSQNATGTVSITVTDIDETRNTDVVSAGVGGLRGNGSGTIELSGISGPVTRALLYWHGPTSSPDGNANVLLNGQGVSGASLGLDFDNNWGFEHSQGFKADVTHLVTGNGSYSLANFVQGDADVNGASLIVFFNDGNAANNVDVALFEGNDANIDGWSASIADVVYRGGSASLELHVSDGQEEAEDYLDGPLGLNGTNLSAGGVLFSGNSLPGGPGPIGNGNLWDIANFDISSFLTPGVQSLTLTSPVWHKDYLSLVVAMVKTEGATTLAATATDAEENGTVTLTAQIGDPGAEDNFTLAVDWGDGSTENFNVAAGVATLTATHQYLDDNPSNTAFDQYSINLQLTGGLDAATASTTATISNVAPTATLQFDEVARVGDPFVIQILDIADPGEFDTFRFAVDWNNDGAFDDVDEQFGALQDRFEVFERTHIFDGEGEYTVEVWLQDDDGGEAFLQAQVRAIRKKIEIVSVNFPADHHLIRDNTTNLLTGGELYLGATFERDIQTRKIIQNAPITVTASDDKLIVHLKVEHIGFLGFNAPYILEGTSEEAALQFRREGDFGPGLNDDFFGTYEVTAVNPLGKQIRALKSPIRWIMTFNKGQANESVLDLGSSGIHYIYTTRGRPIDAEDATGKPENLVTVIRMERTVERVAAAIQATGQANPSAPRIVMQLMNQATSYLQRNIIEITPGRPLAAAWRVPNTWTDTPPGTDCISIATFVSFVSALSAKAHAHATSLSRRWSKLWDFGVSCWRSAAA